MAISDKQQRFIDEYCIDQNATQAYKRAGYSVRSDASAHACAAKLLRNATIRAEIDRRLAKITAKCRLSAEESWSEVAGIARSTIADILDMTGINPKLKPANEIPASALRALKSVKVKRYVEGAGDDAREVELVEFTFWDKLHALVMTLKALGEFKDKHEYSWPGGGGPIAIETTVTVIDAHEKILSFADEIRLSAVQMLAEEAAAIIERGNAEAELRADTGGTAVPDDESGPVPGDE